MAPLTWGLREFSDSEEHNSGCQGLRGTGNEDLLFNAGDSVFQLGKMKKFGGWSHNITSVLNPDTGSALDQR